MIDSLEKLHHDGEIGRLVRDDLSDEDIRALLREGPIGFVEVDAGQPVRRIPPENCFEFWKAARSNLCAAERAYLEDYPNCFFYRASEWMKTDGVRLIVLVKYH